MKFEIGKIEKIERYREFDIVIEHSLNIFEKIQEEDEPIYTIRKMGRCFQGKIEDVRKFIDDMYIRYGDKQGE